LFEKDNSGKMYPTKDNYSKALIMSGHWDGLDVGNCDNTEDIISKFVFIFYIFTFLLKIYNCSFQNLSILSNY